MDLEPVKKLKVGDVVKYFISENKTGNFLIIKITDLIGATNHHITGEIIESNVKNLEVGHISAYFLKSNCFVEKNELIIELLKALDLLEYKLSH